MNQGCLGMQPVLSTHIPLAKTESHEITEWLERLRSNLSMCPRERGNQFWTKMDNWNRFIPEVLSSGPWKESMWKGTSVPESFSQSCAFQPRFFFLLLLLDLKTIHTAGKTILKRWDSQDATGEADLSFFIFIKLEEERGLQCQKLREKTTRQQSSVFPGKPQGDMCPHYLSRLTEPDWFWDQTAARLLVILAHRIMGIDSWTIVWNSVII